MYMISVIFDDFFQFVHDKEMSLFIIMSNVSNMQPSLAIDCGNVVTSGSLLFKDIWAAKTRALIAATIIS